MTVALGLTLDQFVNPENLTFTELLLVSLVYTVVLVALGYAGAIVWQKWRDGQKRRS